MAYEYREETRKNRWRRSLMLLESLGVGVFYIGMLAFLLYPVVHASA